MTGFFIVLTIALALYSTGHYLCAFLFVVRRRMPTSASSAQGSVAVLIPAKDEGEVALGAIRSVLDQNYEDLIEVIFLVKDRKDSSVSVLLESFPNYRETSSFSIQLQDDPIRKVRLAFVGKDAKSEKINWAVEHCDASHLAILDCDHKAEPEWVASSMQILSDEGSRFVQCRRTPMSAHGIFGLWDSHHQHIGCELFNIAFSGLNLTVFFTGTTAVMHRSVLTEHPLRACVTEDVDLSYQLMLEGEKIVCNPHSGSAEAVSPDLYSFLARRRRWASGHTEAFLGHIGKFWSPALTGLDRVQYLFHGVHYLLALCVLVLQLQIALYFSAQLSPISNISSLVLGALISFAVARTQGTISLWGRFLEWVSLSAWFAPAVVIGVNLFAAILTADLTRATLPIATPIAAMALVGLSAPLVLIVVGLAGLRQLSIRVLLATILSYPVAFYLDVAGVLLGLCDLVAGRQAWRPVHRDSLTAQADSNTAGIRAHWRLRGAPVTWRARVFGFVLFFCGSCLFGFASFHASASRIVVSATNCQARQHDTYPWIRPIDHTADYCRTDSDSQERWSDPSGLFRTVVSDDFKSFNSGTFDSLASTFPCNEAHFVPQNVLVGQKGLQLKLEAGEQGDRRFISGSIATKNTDAAKFLYGRFETTMKPVKASGVVSAFFLYRFDPWQEIDAEFLGNDTTKLLVNVYYNPGEKGDLYNYGFYGTPTTVDLGFDAADDFHRYAVEWDPKEIRWFVDDRLVHARRAGSPTPIPHLPMRFHVNVWPTCSAALAGPFDETALPVQAEIHELKISQWRPSPFAKVSDFLGTLFQPESQFDWRDTAAWVQPGR